MVPIKSSTPWINREIRKDIAKRELFYKRYKKSNSQDWLSKFRALRNKIVTNIRDAKKQFFFRLSTCRSDPKKFWCIIKSVKPRTSLPCSLSNGQVTVTLIKQACSMSTLHLVSIQPYNYLPTLSFPSVQRVMRKVMTSPRMRSTCG